MLPASLIARLGIPLLLEALAPSLRKLPEGKGDSAADALDALRHGLNARQDTSEVKEANHHLEEILSLRLQHETQLLREVNRSLRVEAQSQDPYVRRWRPTFGYAVAAAWVAQTCALTWVVVFRTDKADVILSAAAELTFMWGVALSVLGVGVVKRSHDKAVASGATVSSPVGLLSSFFAKR